MLNPTETWNHPQPGALQQGWQWLVSILYVILACGNVQRYSSEDAIAEARGPFWAAAQDVDDEGIDGVVHGLWADIRTDMNWHDARWGRQHTVHARLARARRLLGSGNTEECSACA